MKTRLTVVLAVMLLVLCTVPALAAPKLQLDFSFMYGQVGYDYGEPELDAADYLGDAMFFNWAIVPRFRIYAEVLPGFGLSLTRWYANGEEYYLKSESRKPDSEGRTGVYDTELMGEWQVLDLPNAQISVLGGVRIMAVSQDFAGIYVDSAGRGPGYGDLVGVDTNLIGLVLGVSGQIRIVDNLWAVGSLSGAALWGKSHHTLIEQPEEYLFSSSPSVETIASPTFAPQGELQLGLKYFFAPNLYMVASFQGSALLINPNGNCSEIVYVGGPQISLGLQF